jgi:beta-N-acetylhexosaminidase
MLRKRIGFQGLIITDELGMNGATASAGSLSAAAKAALLAGNDVVMLDQTPSLNDPVWTNLAAALQTDPVFQKRVRDAALRVLTVKLSRLRREDAPAFIPDPARVDTELPSREGAAFFQDLAARSVTVVWGDETMPLRPENAGTVLLAGQYNDFFSSGRAAYPGATPYWYSLTRGIDDFLWFVRRADTVIFCISGSDGLPLVQALRDQGTRVILFSVLSPVYLDAADWADAAVAVYSDSRESFAAGFSALTGRIPARGRPPYEAPHR